jgi:two-component system heavy metal sensor histidine kinase CusS
MRSQLEVALTSPRNAVCDQNIFAELVIDVERLTRIAAALLILARGDSEQLRLSYDAVETTDFLRRVTDPFIEQAAERGVSLSLEAQAGTFTADEDKLTQVLFNLVDNALRYAPPGTSIRLAGHLDPNGVTFTVSDAGPGIPTEHQSHIFDRFYRVESGREDGASGVGLGLSICQMIVRAHGGAIAVASTTEAGTTMRVWIPRHPPNSQAHS